MLTLWKPLAGSGNGIRAAEREIERMFRDFALPGFAWGGAPATLPAADVIEAKDELRVRLDLPGLDPKDIRVNVEHDVLTVEAERKLEREEKGETYHRSEVSYGSVRRSFALPATVDASRTAARYESGVLTITLPKREEAKPRRIDVKIG